MPTCECGKPIHDTGVICWDCTHALRDKTLAQIIELGPELEVTLARIDRIGETEGSRSTETPVPFNTGASTAAHEVHGTLSTWATFIAAKRGGHRTAPGHSTIAGHARFITSQLAWLRCHPAAPKAKRELTAAKNQLARACDARAELIALGPCIAVGCPGQLSAPHGKATTRCPDCGRIYNTDDRTKQLLTLGADRLFTARQTHHILNAMLRRRFPESTLNSWITRGRLAQHGTDQNGHGLYRLGDAVELLLDQDQPAPATTSA
ncbi:hypothetical protein [Glycomyces tarimensis]